MPLEKSEAFILKLFNWSESSRTVVFFSRDFGKLPLVDKGGRRFKSKRGRLLQFARMELTFYSSEKTTSGYISDSEILELYSFEKEGTLGRLAYGSAACELVYLLLPEQQPQPTSYEYCLTYFRIVARADKQYLPAIFLTFYIRLMSQLGYRPSLAYCVGCSKELEKIVAEESQPLFSPERGGMTCRACQRAGEQYIPLSADGARLLAALQRASLDEAASLPVGYQDAALLTEALTKFLKYHSGLVSDLKSLAFLEKLKKAT
jgi:DNA repair protein RecO (recombination protein O)